MIGCLKLYFEIAFYLSNGPFNHGTASHTSSVDFFEIIIWVTQVTTLHLFTNFIAEYLK